jgi:hypothetical protein
VLVAVIRKARARQKNGYFGQYKRLKPFKIRAYVMKEPELSSKA